MMTELVSTRNVDQLNTCMRDNDRSDSIIKFNVTNYTHVSNNKANSYLVKQHGMLYDTWWRCSSPRLHPLFLMTACMQ